MSAIRAVIEGVALERSSADATRSLPELIFDCVSAALRDAGLTMADVDSVCIAGEDLIDGRSLSSMITGPAAGAYLRDEMRVSEDGLTALSLATAQIEAGSALRVIVAAFGRASETDPQRAASRSFDPFIHQPIGLTSEAVSALRATALRRRTGGLEPAAAATARAERGRRAAANPWAGAAAVRTISAPYPLHTDDLRREVDAVAALVIAAPEHAAARPTARHRGAVLGAGHGTEPSSIADRDLLGFPGAAAAVMSALAQADRDLDSIDLVEVAGSTLVDEALLAEAIGWARPGEGFTALTDDVALNPSGGGAAGECQPATGLLRLVEAVLRLSELGSQPSAALVVAGSAIAGQTHTAIVVGSA